MTNARLKRELGLSGAVVTGLGSILGTGAFVSIGLAAGMWGDVVMVAIPLAGVVAVFNGLSSAFLAGRFPVAGGTYEYAYNTLNPWLGFTAGWLFLLAKTASAAAAALGVALYLGLDTPLAPLAAVLLVTALVMLGVRRTTAVNLALISLTIAAIVRFAASGVNQGQVDWALLTTPTPDLLLPAVAFLFVAYTGYGRIATLGEEVKTPELTIPRAVIITLVAAVLLYLGIELGGRAEGGPFWGSTIRLGFSGDPLVAVGAVAAMLGVLLNLVLGLSRVWLAMGRRGDMPLHLSRLDKRSEPAAAIALTGVLIGVTTLVGDLSVAWSFSATTVLLYYGITNLAALRLDVRRITAWLGLASCVFLSAFVPSLVWLTAVALIGVGLAWKAWSNR